MESIEDDWISDYEIQGDYEQKVDFEPREAFAAMVRQAADWIGRDVLVPGQMLQNGFVPWPRPAPDNARRFITEAGDLAALTLPRQICWFDVGPLFNAERALYGL